MSMAEVRSLWLRHANKAVTSPVVAQLAGQLPAWLHGSLYRNGSGIKEVGPDRYNHLFDGLACVHKFHIDGPAGRVTYQNRFLDSNHYRANMAANRIEASEFGTLGRQDLCRSLFGRLMSIYQDMRGPDRSMSDNCAVNVGYFGSHLYAMTETNRIWKLNDDDLAAEKQVDLSKVVSVDMATAHPHVTADGTIYNIGSSFSGGKRPSVNFIEFPADASPGCSVAESGRIVACNILSLSLSEGCSVAESGRIVGCNILSLSLSEGCSVDESGWIVGCNILSLSLSEGCSVAESGRIVGSLPHRWPLEPSYFHSFGITENYFVFVQQPLVIQVKKIPLLKLKKKPFIDAIAAKPEQETWIRLVNKRTGEVHPTTFTADTFYAFHHVNSFEQDGNVVMDICGVLPGKQNVMEKVSVRCLVTDQEEPEDPMLRFVLPLQVKPGDPNRNQVILEGSPATAHVRGDGTVHCVPQTLTPSEYRSVDLPRINYAFNGKPYRFAYACRFVGAGLNSERLLKLDVASGQVATWSDPCWSPSEPVFVAAPGADAEDAGLLLASLLHVEDQRRASLLVLDATNMGELARAEVRTDATLAKDFHGLFAASGAAVHAY
ncbi:retinal Mueller cells isomerohydrolase-like [Pollicipes pollicipes]|uniref:retinal Mueller cells isomerohydrolase-like n=1 Tax=Pollicipes pollicipes TaxID=41117 RepID=UPI0018851CBC|nr:retinal Mueller cells isomerohydrolase-like [Pollicipes pollicipes]